ncbi:WD repeat-containing protein 55, partial [Bienertia sinuspersici]
NCDRILDCSILATDVETGTKIAHLENAHTRVVYFNLLNYMSWLYSQIIAFLLLKMCGIPGKNPVTTLQVHEEYISDMTFTPDTMKLLATSGDGMLSVCSLRSNKVQAQSEFCEDEPLSVVIMKNGRKVICGTQTGTLLLYSWGFFKDRSDLFVDLSPNPVDALLKYDEDRVITGSSNGLIGLLAYCPTKSFNQLPSIQNIQLSVLLWDMDELLQGPGLLTRNDAATLDSDSDGMDVDPDTSNSS